MTRTPWNQVRDDSRLVEVMSAITAARDGAGPERQPLSVFIMPNLTLNGLESFIDYQSLLGGVDVTVTMGRYNVLHQDLMNPDSMVFTAKPQLLVLALAWDVFVPDRDATVEIVIERLEQLFMLAANRAKCAVVVNTFVLPGAVYDRGAAAMSLNGRIHAVNDWIRHFVAEHQAVFFLCDWNAYVQQTGREAALDDRYWMMAKAPFRPAFLARYGADIAKIGRALLGLNKKVLILDCDNTLWGGVLGEDGIDGIRLHSDDYPGNAYQAAQRIVLDLTDLGFAVGMLGNVELVGFAGQLRHPRDVSLGHQTAFQRNVQGPQIRHRIAECGLRCVSLLAGFIHITACRILGSLRRCVKISLGHLRQQLRKGIYFIRHLHGGYRRQPGLHHLDLE